MFRKKTPSKRSSPSKGVKNDSKEKTDGKDGKVPKVLFTEESAESDPVTGKGSDESDNANGEKRDKAYYKKMLAQEKEGKRKLFHALVKLVGELKIYKGGQGGAGGFDNQAWYEGGLWRAPRVLPNIETQPQNKDDRTRVRQAVSLSDLFFNLVIVTAFTRVGLAITRSGTVTTDAFLYFAVFWTIWSKEASYTTRFDTTDLSAKAGTLVTCFAVLFASLSASAPMDSEGGSRIMFAAAFCSLLHFGLMARVFFWHSQSSDDAVDTHVQHYALFNSTMNFLESLTWILGMVFCPKQYRWVAYTIGVLLGLRIPRAFMANDFHAACSKRGVLFILLLGFMMQSVVVAATDFFEYTTPNDEQYAFIGAACLLLFCIKLLYVDDSSTLAADHALLVNRTAALFFNLGQFALLFSTTIMGSGLNLLTHSYLASAAALPGNAKSLVCGGFSAVLISTVFIKSMHLKRVPVAGQQKALFIGAYVIQTVATIAISSITFLMSMGEGGYFQVLMQNDVELMWVLTGFALFLVILSWLDEGLELALHDDESGNAYLVHPFGFWWCLKPEVDMEDILAEERAQENRHGRLSVLSPLLGESVAKNMSLRGYDSTEYVTPAEV